MTIINCFRFLEKQLKMDRWDDIQLLSNLGLKANYQQDSDPWPQRIPMRCPTNWAMKPHIGSSDMNSTRNKLSFLPMCGFIHCSSVDGALHWYSQRSWVWIPLKPWFFQALVTQTLVTRWDTSMSRLKNINTSNLPFVNITRQNMELSQGIWLRTSQS